MPEGFYTFRVVESGDGYRATEPGTEPQTWGRGQSPAEAIRNYCEVLDDA
jgi:hypothetical protein